MTIYIIALDGDSLDLKLGDQLCGGRVIRLEAELEPPSVSASWLAKNYGYTPAHVRNVLSEIKEGGPGKYTYPRIEAIALLTAKSKRRGPKRQN